MRTAEIGVVVPVFGHSLLAAEAIQSALDQDTPDRVRIVAVNDGCKLPQTHEILSELALAHPGRVDYVQKPNGGLSSARNAGVRRLLRHAPDVEAIYFLDADNRLERGSLRRAAAVLRAHPEAGWVYPDIDEFGLEGHHDFAGAYSLLMHTQLNVSEAGSLVRAQVFRDGIYFDEDMRQGYEDWEFFLRVAEAGWTGVHLSGLALQYRRRPESMLSESTELDGQLRASIARKHKALFQPAAVVELEARQSPRYALVSTADREALLFTDPSDGASVTRIPFAELERRVWASLIDPGAAPLPSFLLVAEPGVWRSLTKAKLAHGVLWRLERHLDEAHFAAAHLRPDVAPGLTEGALPRRGPSWRSNVDVAMVRADVLGAVLRDPNSKWFRSLWGARPAPRVRLSVVSTPHARPEGARRKAMTLLRGAIEAFQASKYADARDIPRGWKAPGLPARSYISRGARRAVGVGGPIAPHRPDPERRNVAFVLPIFAFGGVERVARQMAGELRTRGFRPHLVVWERSSAPGLGGDAAPFETVSFLDCPSASYWSEESAYLGSPLAAWRDRTDEHGLAVGLLATMDAVVFAHTISANEIAGRLRRFGVATLNHVHVTDLSSHGRPVGHTMTALAYDHVFDKVIACSHTLASWLEGMGVPGAKIMTVPNGPGFDVDMARAEAAAAEKARRTGPLRVLFIGRLDRQKGMERVLAVARHFDASGRRDIELRVVGAGVLEEAAVDQGAISIIDWRPKTLDADELMGHYEWADVMLLLSHWEGLPLAIIEAQLFGVVPLATRVGAMEELVAHGVTGYLVDREDAVRETIAALQALLHDRSPLAAVAESAHRAARERTWAKAVAPLAEYLAALPPRPLPAPPRTAERRHEPALG